MSELTNERIDEQWGRLWGLFFRYLLTPDKRRHEARRLLAEFEHLRDTLTEEERAGLVTEAMQSLPVNGREEVLAEKGRDQETRSKGQSE